MSPERESLSFDPITLQGVHSPKERGGEDDEERR